MITRFGFIKALAGLLLAPFVIKQPRRRSIREEDFAFKILDGPCFIEASWVEEPIDGVCRLRMLK